MNTWTVIAILQNRDLRDREAAQQLADSDSQLAAALRGRAQGYRQAIALLRKTQAPAGASEEEQLFDLIETRLIALTDPTIIATEVGTPVQDIVAFSACLLRGTPESIQGARSIAGAIVGLRKAAATS